MLSAMTTEFPPDVTWTAPASGLIIWAQMPASIDATELLKEALAEQVA